jgi:hypothetical protein
VDRERKSGGIVNHDTIIMTKEHGQKVTSSALLNHDVWNFCCLTIICTMDLIYLYSTDTSKLRTPELGEETVDFFYIFFYVVAAYTVLDTLWILFVPTCVPANPMALVIHHILTFLLILVPYTVNQFAWHFACTLLVEFNTIIIILRRNVPLESLVHSIMHAMFLITTLLFRVIMFPALTVFFAQEYIRYSISLGGDYVNCMFITPVALGLLSLMGFQWLFAYAKKQLFRKTKDSKAS